MHNVFFWRTNVSMEDVGRMKEEPALSLIQKSVGIFRQIAAGKEKLANFCMSKVAAFFQIQIQVHHM